MTKQKPQRPKWATEYLQFDTWTLRDFGDLLRGVRPDWPVVHMPNRLENPDGFKKAQQRLERHVRARNKVERKIRDAIRAGVLPVFPSFAQKELLDKIKPHIDDQLLDQIKRAVVAGDIYGHGEVYYFAPADAIRWASSKDWFPRFFFSRKDIASVDKAKSSLMDTQPGPGATLESVEVDEAASTEQLSRLVRAIPKHPVK